MNYTSNPKGINPHRFYFQEADENCYSLGYHLDYMKENFLTEMKVYLAIPEVSSDYFYCKHFQVCGERGDCGKSCEAYTPRNGKSGVCKHFAFTYEISTKEYLITII